MILPFLKTSADCFNGEHMTQCGNLPFPNRVEEELVVLAVEGERGGGEVKLKVIGATGSMFSIKWKKPD